MLNRKDTSYYKTISYNFNKLIEQISSQNQNNLDWWVTSAADRNPFVSRSFQEYCAALNSINRQESLKPQNNNLAWPKLSTVYIAQLFRNLFKSLKNKFKKIIRVYLILFYEVLKRIFQLVVARITKKNNLELRGPLILIDIFAFPGYYSKDRYYNGLWDKLSNDEKSFTYFVPTLAFTKIKDYFKAYKEIRNIKRNVLVKEDFLKVSDIAYALLHFFRVRFLKFPTIIENGIDFSKPIKEEIKSFSRFSSAIEGILNYRFIRRLKKNNVDIKLVLDWWESQAPDKGLHLALHRYYPDIPVIGYLGYAPRDLELQLFPTEYESNAHVIPKIIGVIGDGFVESIKRYYPQQNVTKVPAFRFQHLWDEKKSKVHNKPSILIALTVLHGESIGILNLVKQNLEVLKKTNLDILIKPHPTMTIEQMKKGLESDWPSEFEIVQGPTDEYIRSSKILVTGMSSIALESLAIGKPTIVIEHAEDLPLIPIPNDIPQDMWRYCSGESQFCDAFEQFIYMDCQEQENFAEKGKNIRAKYFEPVSRDGVLKLLKL